LTQQFIGLELELALQDVLVIVQDEFFGLMGHYLYPDLYANVSQQTQLVVRVLEAFQLNLGLWQRVSVSGKSDVLYLRIQLLWSQRKSSRDIDLVKSRGDSLVLKEFRDAEISEFLLGSEKHFVQLSGVIGRLSLLGITLRGRLYFSVVFLLLLLQLLFIFL
jgi:hypothetical protein